MANVLMDFSVVASNRVYHLRNGNMTEYLTTNDIGSTPKEVCEGRGLGIHTLIFRKERMSMFVIENEEIVRAKQSETQ